MLLMVSNNGRGVKKNKPYLPHSTASDLQVDNKTLACYSLNIRFSDKYTDLVNESYRIWALANKNSVELNTVLTIPALAALACA
jgi:hypothetical protein